MKKNDLNNTLSHAEIYNFALSVIGKKAAEGVKMIKNLKGEDKALKLVTEMYAPWIFKAKKLCELYELETGVPYDGLAAMFGIEISDLDID